MSGLEVGPRLTSSLLKPKISAACSLMFTMMAAHTHTEAVSAITTAVLIEGSACAMLVPDIASLKSHPRWDTHVPLGSMTSMELRLLSKMAAYSCSSSHR